MRAFLLVTSTLLLAAACVVSSHLRDSPEPEIDRPRWGGRELVPERVPAFQDVTPEWQYTLRAHPAPRSEQRVVKPRGPYYCYALEDCPRLP